MQRELTSILGALAVLLMAYVPSMRAEDTERRTLVAMKSSIQKGDLAQFIQTVAEKKWQPVAIASAWYVENRVPKEQRPDEADKRAFGKLLEERVAALATQLAAATEPDRLRKDSETLLALADWCEGAKGYGNLILAARCRDVAMACPRTLIHSL